tara:strand:- start:9 stop:533 length:525 start_codon:yes stop_codon:yes gene_type:complete
MDVSGFVMHIKEAEHDSNPGIALQDIKSVSLEALSTEFKKYDSWKDLSDKDSKLVKFLDKHCYLVKNEPNIYSPIKLRMLGILWCQGTAEEKSTELYDAISPGKDFMVSTDKDFKPNIFQLLSFATQTIYEEFKDSQYPMDLLDSIEDRFDEMCEEFLDNIFECESRAQREDFI